MSARPRRGVALLACAACAAPLGAQTPDESDPPHGDGADLARRVQELEEEVSRLQLEGPAGEDSGKHPVLAGVEMELYGYVKVDAAYDTARTSVGNFARWVESEGANEDDDQFSLTAKQTRLGMKLRGPRGGDLESRGRVEVDFYGGGSENKPTPMMRHAYLEWEWPASRWTLLAGQTSDVISPLCAPTVNYTAAWWQGNSGYRRPQVRLTRAVDVSEDAGLTFAVAASRTITGRTTEFTPKDGDTGSDAGFPTFQSRVGLSLPALEDARAELGLSGHWGQEEQDLDETGASEDADSWSLHLDAKVPVSSRVTLLGELYTGENLDAYLGCIGQGFNGSTGDEIAAAGGWLAASVRASELWDLNFGLGLDDPSDGDVESGGRTENRLYFANAFRHLDASSSVAFELAYLDTDYRDQASGDAIRAQIAFIYRF